MRKLKFQIQLSVDGFIAGPNGEMDWLTWNWDDELKNYVTAFTQPVDCILLGRKLAEGFIPVWKSRATDPATADEFGQKMVDIPKVVFTKTLEQSDWENTTLATGDLVTEVNALKKQVGGDIVAYGGAGFASALIKAGLIDEYHLFINPVAIGKGLTIFADLTEKQNLKLVEVRAFACGVALLCYQPA